MKPLSDIAAKLQGQPMFKLLERVQQLERKGRKILHFELGEPDFRTPENIAAAGCRAIEAGKTHYTSSKGLYEFREEICRTTNISRHFLPDMDQILVTPGANAIIYYAIKCLVNPGESVLVPNPGFPTYFSAISACGVQAVNVPLRSEKNFIMQPEDVEAAIVPSSKLLIINSPGNPTGAVIPHDTMLEICRIAEKYDLYVISDEIYARLVYSSSEKFFSPAMLDHCRERFIVINGFSKAFAMTGWRLGVAIGPAPVIAKMTLLNETIVSCVPPFVQYAGIEAISGDQTQVRHMAEEYKKRVFLLADLLNDVPGIRCPRPAGSIYVFPDISGTGMSSEEFADFALNQASMAILPGNNFGEFGEGFVRFSCVVGEAQIRQGVSSIREALTNRK